VHKTTVAKTQGKLEWLRKQHKRSDDSEQDYRNDAYVFLHSAADRQTYRQTDSRTDGRENRTRRL